MHIPLHSQKVSSEKSALPPTPHSTSLSSTKSYTNINSSSYSYFNNIKTSSNSLVQLYTETKYTHANSLYTPSSNQSHLTYTSQNPISHNTNKSQPNLPIQKYDDETSRKYLPVQAFHVLDTLCQRHGTTSNQLFNDIKRVFQIIPNDTSEFTYTNTKSIDFIKNFYNADKKYTERELVETFSTNLYIRTILLDHHTSLSNLSTKLPTTADKTTAILDVMKSTHYYHATLATNAAAIFDNGLVFQDKHAKNGISNFSAINREAAITYMRWSKGYSFITDNFAEAKSYSESLQEKCTQPTKILDVFVDSHAIIPRLEIDPDSKGLKSAMPIYTIGMDHRLNVHALKFLKDILKHMGYTDITNEEILSAYKRL